MADDEVEISVGTDSLTVKSGGNAAARITNTIADLLSPFSEATGVIGDVIHYYRQDMALRAIARARDIAKETGANLQPVPPKFLVKWVEDASLEESENDELVDLWAGLLVSASTEFSPIHFQTRRILSELTLDHIGFLEMICETEFKNNYEFEFGADHSTFNEIVKHGYENPLIVDSIEFNKIAPILKEANTKRLKFHSAKLQKLEGFSVNSEVLWNNDLVAFRSFDSSFVTKYLLEVGIINDIIRDIVITPKTDNQKYVLYLKAYHLTDFGVTFLKACLPKRINDGNRGTTP